MIDDVITGDIGGRLQRAREKCGLSLQDLAGRTKLSIGVLRAIERNDFKSLPAGVYRKGYLRSLAGEVGLDPAEIAADYDREFDPGTGPLTQAAISAGSNSTVALEQEWVRQLTPSPRRSIVTLVIALVLSIGWFAWRNGVERPLPIAIPAGDVSPTVVPVEPVAASSPAIHRASELAQGMPLRIEIAATDWCWVAAESDGARALYRLVGPGEHVILEGQRMISLRLGDAGSVTLSINDGPRRLAGSNGEVVELMLTPGNVGSLRDGAETVSGA
jgi:cytoskeleton protein RodZ